MFASQGALPFTRRTRHKLTSPIAHGIPQSHACLCFVFRLTPPPSKRARSPFLILYRKRVALTDSSRCSLTIVAVSSPTMLKIELNGAPARARRQLAVYRVFQAENKLNV